MKKPLITPPIIIGSLIFLIIAVTLFFHFRAEDRRELNLLHCKDVATGMSVQQVLEIMGKPDDIIKSDLSPKLQSFNQVQYIYLAPLETYKTIVVVFDAQQMVVAYTECID